VTADWKQYALRVTAWLNSGFSYFFTAKYARKKRNLCGLRGLFSYFEKADNPLPGIHPTGALWLFSRNKKNTARREGENSC